MQYVRKVRSNAVGVQTINHRIHITGSCRHCKVLDKTRHPVPTALLVRAYCLWKRMQMAVEGEAQGIVSSR